MDIEIIDTDTLIEIPSELAVCPICGAEVVIEDIDEWEEDDAGRWRVSESGLHVNCITEPDIDSDELDGWMKWHWSTPYVDWLPINVKVWEWLDSRYRFALAFAQHSLHPTRAIGVTKDGHEQENHSYLETL